MSGCTYLWDCACNVWLLCAEMHSCAATSLTCRAHTSGGDIKIPQKPITKHQPCAHSSACAGSTVHVQESTAKRMCSAARSCMQQSSFSLALKATQGCSQSRCMLNLPSNCPLPAQGLPTASSLMEGAQAGVHHCCNSFFYVARRSPACMATACLGNSA